MGMKKKMLSATLCAVMVGSLAAPAFTVQAADDTLVYWSMWEATEPQGQVIQEAVDAYTEQTGVKVDLQFKGRTGNREALQPALDGGTQIDIFDEDIDRVNGMYGKYLLDLEDLAKENDYEATANAGLMAACRDAGGGTLKTSTRIRAARNVVRQQHPGIWFWRPGAKTPPYLLFIISYFLFIFFRLSCLCSAQQRPT